MRKRVQTTRLIALAAAYVVVLQALLLPLSVAAASPLANSLCRTLADIGGAPADADTGSFCAAVCGALCCAPGLSGGAPTLVAFEPTPAGVLTVVRAGQQAALTLWRTPQNPRAPPQA